MNVDMIIYGAYIEKENAPLKDISNLMNMETNTSMFSNIQHSHGTSSND